MYSSNAKSILYVNVEYNVNFIPIDGTLETPMRWYFYLILIVTLMVPQPGKRWVSSLDLILRNDKM